jgi:hypothetical protein
LSACATAPRAGPLTGVPTTQRLPVTVLPEGHRRILFSWEYRERVGSARGEGAARIAPPDSVRIDLFLDNGNYGGFVILIADSIVATAQDEARRSLPPPALLWASLGVVRVQAPDTTVLIDGDTLRAQLGVDPAWRVAFGPASLARVDRIVRGRMEETVERTDSTRVVYRQPGAGRSLELTIRQVIREPGFDPTIWRP